MNGTIVRVFPEPEPSQKVVEDEMKKVLLAGILAIGLLGPAFADSQFRIAGGLSGEFARIPSVEQLKDTVRSGDRLFYGLQWEIVFDRLGFGMHYGWHFDRIRTAGSSDRYDWTLDLVGDLFLSYHLFGGGAFIDPFVELGYGIAAAVDTFGYSGTWDDSDQGRLTHLSGFPVLAAGLALDLHGFMIGARLAYRPTSGPLPGSQIEEFPLQQVQFGAFGGLALGGH
jgi:hypothetical protein